MQLLEKHFDLAFTAPNGVQKLRELILTFAMQGKLVPQDPNDQPASELLKEIEVEKKRLVEEGKIKQPKPLPEVKPEELPYVLPRGWEWVRIRNICHDWGQKTPDKLFTYIDVGSIDNKRGVISNDVQLLEGFDAPSRARKIVRRGTVIYSTVRPYLLNIAIIDKDFSLEPIASTAFAILHPFCEISNRFIYYYLRSPMFIDYVESTMKGVAYPAINDGDFFQGLFPLPPIAEQHRIVAKIDRLMAQCDELENLGSDRNQKRITVHTAALNQLLTAKENSDFSTAWGFITQHFGALYSVKENVAELRKAILQLAVMGKLVPQDPTDEPASKLLRAIDLEKQKLVEDGKIKQSKLLVKSSLEERHYPLPQGWKWTHLETLLALVTDGDHAPPPKADTGIPFLVIGNLNKGKVTLNNCRFVPHSYYESLDWGKKPIKNDILYTVTGSYGIPIFVDTDHEFCVQRHVAILKSVESSPIKYLTHFLKSRFVSEYATSVATGIAQKTVPLSGLRRMPIAVPPLWEQDRIVAKIDRLMALCDRLDQQIDAATDKRTELLNALMARV